MIGPTVDTATYPLRTFSKMLFVIVILELVPVVVIPSYRQLMKVFPVTVMLVELLMTRQWLAPSLNVCPEMTTFVCPFIVVVAYSNEGDASSRHVNNSP